MVTTFIYSCGFQLFLLPYILLFQNRQILMTPHTKVQGGMPPMSPPIFAIHHQQQWGGKGWRKSGFGWAGCNLGRWEQQGEGNRERGSEKMVLV